ncbi:recombinase family protein [Candidatus Gracilibacteria bacterium]|nr:recombinase family protein [Candidatus Gracilibacteria bacterium]
MENENNKIPAKKKLRVAFYIRVSKEDQKEMYGPKLQLASLRGLLKGREYDLEFAGEEYIYKDLAKSGSLKIDDRPGMKKLFNDLKYGKPFDIVAVYKIDRFARSLKVLLEVVDRLKEKGIDFISTLETIDTSSHFGKAMLGILGVFAELEKDMNQIKMNDGKISSIINGNKINNIYGYDRYKEGKLNLFKINKIEGKIVEKIFNDFISPRTLGDLSYIRDDLIEKKVLCPGAARNTKANKDILNDPYKWNNEAIKRILSNEIYIGVYSYGKTKKNDNKDLKNNKVSVPKDKWTKSEIKHCRIISDETFKKAQEILKSIKVESHINSHTNNGNIYIFTGLLKCDDCKNHRKDGKMYSWIGDPSNGRNQYICKGKHKTLKVCNTIPLQSYDLDKIILGEIKNLIKNPIAIKKYIKNDDIINEEKNYLIEEIEVAETKINDLKKGQDNLYKILLSGKLEAIDYEKDYERLQDDINKKQQEKDELQDKLDGEFEIEDYNHSLKVLGDILERDIDDILSDPLKAQKFMKYLIDEIIIYSKDDDGTYSLSGPKKEGRKIPYKIEVKLKLPQEFINNFLELNDITGKDIVGEHLWEKIEETEKENNKKGGKGGGKGGGGALLSSSNYNKVTDKLKNIKENLSNGEIRVKNFLSP